MCRPSDLDGPGRPRRLRAIATWQTRAVVTPTVATDGISPSRMGLSTARQHPEVTQGTGARWAGAFGSGAQYKSAHACRRQKPNSLVSSTVTRTCRASPVSRSRRTTSLRTTPQGNTSAARRILLYKAYDTSPSGASRIFDVSKTSK